MASSDDPNRFLQRAGSDNRARQQPQPQGPGDRMSNWARAARLTDAHNMRGVPPEYQRSSTDAIQIPEYMRAETLMKQLVAHQKFTTDQLAFLDTQKMSQQQASILCDLCRNHMKKDGLGDDVASKNMRIISTAIAHHTFEELNPNLEEFFESTSNRNEGNSHADAPITHDQAIDANRLMEDFKSTVKPSVLENLSHRLTYSLHGRSP